MFMFPSNMVNGKEGEMMKWMKKRKTGKEKDNEKGKLVRGNKRKESLGDKEK